MVLEPRNSWLVRASCTSSCSTARLRQSHDACNLSEADWNSYPHGLPQHSHLRVAFLVPAGHPAPSARKVGPKQKISRQNED